ncbi:MAG: hypothetical protein K2X09_02305 [Rickettsiales bacterium]|nr:hypothetical protein [Rickettsiales bacterium]
MGDTPRPQVLIVAGPGMEAFGASQVENIEASMKAAGAEVIRVGNGVDPITVEQVQQAAARLHQGPATVFFQAHGAAKNGGHFLNFSGANGGFVTPTGDVLSAISKARGGQPTDIFMASCEGGGALEAAATNLPKRSVFVNLAEANQDVHGGDVADFVNAAIKNPLRAIDAKTLLSAYLANGLANRDVIPTVTVVGEGATTMKGLFDGHVGRPFTQEERGNVHRALNGAMDSKEADALMDRIGSAKSEYDIGAKDYGKALLICYDALSADQAKAHRFSRSDNVLSAVEQFAKGATSEPIRPHVAAKQLEL